MVGNGERVPIRSAIFSNTPVLQVTGFRRPAVITRPIAATLLTETTTVVDLMEENLSPTVSLRNRPSRDNTNVRFV